jgi:hypothetical protein
VENQVNIVFPNYKVNKSIYQQGIKLITAYLTTQSIKDLLRDEALKQVD